MYSSSAPSRVCLYGEHQDYLQLKVIPAAINLRLNVYSKHIGKDVLVVNSKETNETIRINTRLSEFNGHQTSFEYYIKAGITALRKAYNGIEIPSLEVSIQSDIPIASGLSSSAALLVGWIKHLIGILNLEAGKRKLAELAYKAEHDILGVPCGRMDQYASSFGEIFSLICTDPPKLKKLTKPDFELIVVDSQTPKLTSEIHGRKVKEIKSVISSFEKISKVSLHDATADDIHKYQQVLSNHNYRTLEGVISIKEDTKIAEKELTKSQPDLEVLGNLLISQQNALREGIKVSIPILDKIVKLGIAKGALGGKLSGAGLGGSVVFLTTSNNYNIVQALKKELKLPVRSVKIDEGASFKQE